ncbi:uncharacterized protein M6B38_386460 [Iris pallida]|uniref:EF-hand domain-containing protein n=1 Tax=Iris pallida TaxID=29817 RepID=A0AAX6G294_IRIPA|nr:uncharacterized protein M6B38_386460 [Iris pallida]
MASWFWKKRGGGGGSGRGKKGEKVVLDGSDIEELVGNKEAFSSYVDHKFHELDRDRDGELSVKELEPAVADIGAALGLPAKGTSPDSDHIYHEVLNEFTQGKQDKVNKSEFKEVLSDILLGMAAGLKRDPIVILRIDGEDLKEFVESPRFELEAIAIFSQMESANATLEKCLKMALEQLSVEQGMPPASDPWVLSNIIEPVLQTLSGNQLEQTACQEMFLEEFKKVVKGITQRLQEYPVIVAHSENTFDGSGIKRLLSNKFELDKLLSAAWKDLPKNHNLRTSKDYLRVALDGIAASAELPPYGAVDQVDTIVNEAFKMVSADDGKILNEDEFKKIMTEILGSIMLQLEGNSVFVSSNSVVHEAASSSILSPCLESEVSQN